MSSLFVDTHNVVAILEKSNAAEGFEQIFDFLSGSYIHYALTMNPHIYILCIKQFWNTASVKCSGDITRLQALVDKKKIVIFEVVIREILQLDDAKGIICFPNEEIFVGLAQMGYEKPSTKLTFYKAFFSSQWKFLIHTILQSLSAKRTSWNEFSTKMDSAVICLSKGQKFNFSKYIFNSLVRNVNSSSKFYMYPRFIQLIIQTQVGDLSTHTTRFISPALTQNLFANMRRVGKGFSGVETPLFEGMLARQPAEEELVDEQVQVDAAVEENVAEDVSHDAIPSPPSHDIPSPTQEPSLPPQQPHITPPALPEGEDFPANFQQKLEIVKLNARVKKLEKSNKVISSKFRRLRKVGASRRVESSDYIEDVFNQGRMFTEDEGIELVKDADIADTEGRQDDKQAEIYNIDLDHSLKVLSMQEDDSEVQEVVEVVTTAKLITDVVTAAASQVSAASATIPAAKPSIPTAAPTVIELDAEYARKLHEEINKDDAEINKDIDWDAAMDHNTTGYKMDFFKGMSYANICQIFQARFDENMRFLFKSREEIEEEDQEIIKSINETPAQKAAKRRKLNEEAQEAQEAKELKKQLEIVNDEDDDVFTEATPLGRKVPVVDYKIVMINNKPRYKIIRADDTHQLYISFITLLKNFDREDLEDLWRIVKERFSTSKPSNFSDDYLLSTLKTMFEKTDGQDAI
nr:hypothetical protein [Tanacetum cinerariifolium]